MLDLSSLAVEQIVKIHTMTISKVLPLNGGCQPLKENGELRSVMHNHRQAE